MPTDPATAAIELDSLGSTHFPDLIADTTASDLARRAAVLIERQTAVAAAGGLEGEDAFAFEVGTLHYGQLIGSDDGRAFLLDLFQAFAASPGWAVFRQMLGPVIAFPLRLGSVRWHQPPFEASPVPPHQDVGFTARDYLWLNCWVTLTHAGERGAGLEVARAKVRTVLKPHMDPQRHRTFFGIALEPAEIAALVPTDAWLRPVLSPGDALMFDQYAPHRTVVEPGMTERRISVELRGCRLEALPADYIHTEKLVLSETASGVAIDWHRRLAEVARPVG